MTRIRYAGCILKLLPVCCAAAVISLGASALYAQSMMLPPQCAGKTGAQLDQCVRNVTQPTNVGGFEPVEQKEDPRQILNCATVNRADEGFCIARNEIILECRTPAKYADFDACARNLIDRPQSPRAADCSRAAPAQRNQCATRNKVFAECLKRDPWLYFICLGEQMRAK